MTVEPPAAGITVQTPPVIYVSIVHATGWRWENHWTLLNDCLLRLRDMYNGGPVESNLDVWSLVNSFMIDCAHFGEALRNGQPGMVTKRDVELAIRRNHYLSICEDYANTWKHFKRKDGTLVAAIWEEGTREEGWYATLVQGPKSVPVDLHGKFDALEVAEKAIEAWRAFMGSHGIPEPELPKTRRFLSVEHTVPEPE